jgi:hypothetical protein
MRRHPQRWVGLVLMGLGFILQLGLSDISTTKGFWTGALFAVAALVLLASAWKENHPDSRWIDAFFGVVNLVIALIVSAPAFSYWF